MNDEHRMWARMWDELFALVLALWAIGCAIASWL